MTVMKKKKKGETLYSGPTKYRTEGEHHEIVKAGRIWYTLKDRGRVSVSTLRLECMGTQYYTDKEDYDTKTARYQQWSRIKRLIENKFVPADSLDLDAIERLLTP